MLIIELELNKRRRPDKHNARIRVLMSCEGEGIVGYDEVWNERKTDIKEMILNIVIEWRNKKRKLSVVCCFKHMPSLELAKVEGQNEPREGHWNSSYFGVGGWLLVIQRGESRASVVQTEWMVGFALLNVEPRRLVVLPATSKLAGRGPLQNGWEGGVCSGGAERRNVVKLRSTEGEGEGNEVGEEGGEERWS
jgi:hypothetical protein